MIHNFIILGKLQIVENAVHSVWDTLRTTPLSDTTISVSQHLMVETQRQSKIKVLTAESLHYTYIQYIRYDC